MKRLFVGLLALPVVAVTILLVSGGASASKNAQSPIAKAAKGETHAAKLKAGNVTRTLPWISPAMLAAASGAVSDENFERSDAGAVTSDADLGAADLGAGNGTLGCSKRDKGKGNERVNQDCSFRRQAEEDIAYNFSDPTNLLAGSNDSRMGFNQCWIEFSTDNGAHWGEVAPPFRQHLNDPQSDVPNTITGQSGTFHTYDAASDPTMAFDSQGRSYFSCVLFDLADYASGLYVTNSPKGADGSFFFNVPMQGRRYIVAEDNDPAVAHDKQFVIADYFPGSPNRDNVYVTWTVFNFDQNGNYKSSPIYGSMSTDFARTWSAPQEISGNSPALCSFGDFFDPTRSFNDCDFDQGADPAVLPNGDLVVIYNNGNTAAGNPNSQQLAVVCHPAGDSTANTANLNCGTPTKVGDDVTQGEPQCDFGRGPEECIPGAYIRTNDFPRIVTNTAGTTLYATWQDYRNGEFDIQVTKSTDGGVTWGPEKTANPDTGLDHYFPAIDLAPKKTDRVGASWFRTARVPNENTTPSGGFAAGTDPGVGDRDSDYVVAGGTNVDTPYSFKVVSPVFPPPNGNQSGFNGDYSGIVINKGEECHPIWSDTRNVDPFAPANGVVNDEDVFTDNQGCPNGKGKVGPGTIGKNG